MPPKFSLALDEDTLENDPASYLIGNAGEELTLRAFLFQRGGIYTKDGNERLGTLTADMIDWATKKELGRGASGSVYCVQHKQTKEPMAVKSIPISSKTHRDEVERELTFLLSNYDTTFIVANYGAFWDPDEHSISIAMEYMSYSLADVSSFNKGLAEDGVRGIMFQIVRALDYLHREKKVIHRDIKPSNILLGFQGEAKLGDFGVSKVLQTLDVSKVSTYVGTMLYMAPERLEEGEYDYSSDVWSLGITFIASATGRNPWASAGKSEGDLNLFQLLKKISGDEVPALPPTFSDAARDFVGMCLKRDPSERATCADLLRHHFFDDYSIEEARAHTKMMLQQTTRLVDKAAKAQQDE